MNLDINSLLSNEKFSSLLSDKKFVEFLKNGEGLNQFYHSPNFECIIPEKYTNVLNDQSISSILNTTEAQDFFKTYDFSDFGF